MPGKLMVPAGDQTHDVTSCQESGCEPCVDAAIVRIDGLLARADVAAVAAIAAELTGDDKARLHAAWLAHYRIYRPAQSTLGHRCTKAYGPHWRDVLSTADQVQHLARAGHGPYEGDNWGYSHAIGDVIRVLLWRPHLTAGEIPVYAQPWMEVFGELPAASVAREPTTMTEKTSIRDVSAGPLVIYADQEGQFDYKGGAGGPYAEIAIALSGEPRIHGLRCDPQLVAPVDTAIPASDPRVAVLKQAKGHYPTWKGPWLLILDGVPAARFFNTKKEGTATGLRTVAIRDWHAGA